MPQILEQTGTTLTRYIQAAALLRILDPVRGDPTAYSLDQDSQSIQGPEDRILKRKFLDAFALICATSKDAASISAACLDKEVPGRTTIRVASNGGVSDITMGYLRNILKILSKFSAQDNKHACRARAEAEVLDKILNLDINRIQGYILALQRSRIPSEEAEDLRRRLQSALPRTHPDAIQGFLDWFSQLNRIGELHKGSDVRDLFTWIRWSEKARNTYIVFLRAAFVNSYGTFSPWTCYIFKLGRYSVAAQILVKTAMKVVEMFDNISVEAIPGPKRVEFSVPSHKTPLISVLRRIPEAGGDMARDKLTKFWSIDDPEEEFRKQCATKLVVHAELQIVSFYDENVHLRPFTRFIGVSKKSCYLCSTFLQYHHAGYAVSSCHQKIYLSSPPQALSPKVYHRYKDLTLQLCVRMESIAREELIERFGLKRQPYPADSTAGVSFMGSDDAAMWEEVRMEDITDLVGGVSISSNSEVPETQPKPDKSTAKSSVLKKSKTSQTQVSTVEGDSRKFRESNNVELTIAAESPSTPSPSNMSCMVFHFITLNGKDQELFMAESITNSLTQKLSWSKLTELLSLDLTTTLLFRATEPITIDAKFHICNERQLMACAQYLANKGVLNVEITVPKLRR